MIRHSLGLALLAGLGSCAGGAAPGLSAIPGAERYPAFETIDIAPDESTSPQPAPCRGPTCGMQYPTGPRSKGIEGDLVVAFIINAAGRAELKSASFIKDSETPEFRESVCAFLDGRQFMFPPGVASRRVLILMPVQFNVKRPTTLTDLKAAEHAMRQMPRVELLQQLNSFHHCL